MVCKCDTASALTPLVHSGAVGVGDLGVPGGPKRLSHPCRHGAEGGQAAVEEDGGHPRVATSSLRTSWRRREGRDGDHERVLEQTAVLGLPGGSGMAFGQTTHRYPPIIWRAPEQTVISNSPPFSARAYFLLLSYSSSSYPLAISMSPINPSYLCPSILIFPKSFPSCVISSTFSSFTASFLLGGSQTPTRARHSEIPQRIRDWISVHGHPGGRTSKRKHFLFFSLCPFQPHHSSIDKTHATHTHQIPLLSCYFTAYWGIVINTLRNTFNFFA